MAQGDITSAFTKAQERINELNKKGGISDYTRNNFLKDSLDDAIDSINRRKEYYKLDLKEETLLKYFKKVYKNLSKERDKKNRYKKEQFELTKKITDYREEEKEANKKGNKSLSKLLKKRRTELETTKELNEVNEEIAKETAKSAGGVGKSLKGGHPLVIIAMVAGEAIVGAAKAIFGVTKDILKKVGMARLNLIKGAYNFFLKIQSLSGNIAADSGLIASESKKMLEDLPSIMLNILNVGGSLEDIGKVFTKFSDVTNRNRLFTGKEYESILELGLGTSLGAEGAAELVGNFNNLGYSLDETLDFTKYVRGKAMSLNLNQSKVLKSIDKTTVALTGFGISMGLKGMTNLVLKAEKMRLDVGNSVKKFADAFRDPEIAVDIAAKARLLGGKFGFYFGDPFTLMAKSMLEPEQLTADLIESLKGKAFKGKNGFDIGPEDREIIRNVASILGHDSEELFNVAIEQGKDLDKLKALENRGILEVNIGEDKAELLKNLMTLNEDGSYSMRLSNGITQRLSEIPSNVSILKTINQDRVNKNSALMRKNLSERIGIAADRFMVGFSKIFVSLNKHFTENDTINNLDKTVKAISSEMIKFINDGFANELGLATRGILKTFNSIITDLIMVWQDPDKGFLKILTDSKDIITDNLIKYLVGPLEYYSGMGVHKLGIAIEKGTNGLVKSRSLMKGGVELQKRGLEKSKDTQFYENNIKTLKKTIEKHNKLYGEADLTSNVVGAGIRASSKTIGKSLAKTGAKTIAKRIPVVGLLIGLWDTASYAIEGNYGQAGMAFASGVLSTVPGLGTAGSIALDAANAGIDSYKDYSVETVQDLVVRPDGSAYKGKKGDALNYINSLSNGFNASGHRKVNIVLNGRILNKYNNLSVDSKTVDDTVIMSSKMVLQQMINNLS